MRPQIEQSEMSRDVYTCTAGELATRDITFRDADESTSVAVEELEEIGYDVAPVRDEENPVGYIERDAVSDPPPSAPLSETLSPITLDEIISSSTSFSEVLYALSDEFFYFLGGRNRVTGILTRADLNTTPAYIHLYDLISLLEEELREVVRTRAPNWDGREDVHIPRKKAEALRDRYKQAKRSNIELDLIDYTQFSTLATVVGSIEACWSACGFSRQGRAKDGLNDITGVRNAVAHSNLVIENTQGGLMSDGRTVIELIDAYEAAEQCLNALQ